MVPEAVGRQWEAGMLSDDSRQALLEAGDEQDLETFLDSEFEGYWFISFSGKLTWADGSETDLPKLLEQHAAFVQVVNKFDAKEARLVHEGMEMKCLDAYHNVHGKHPVLPWFRKQVPIVLSSEGDEAIMVTPPRKTSMAERKSPAPPAGDGATTLD